MEKQSQSGGRSILKKKEMLTFPYEPCEWPCLVSIVPTGAQLIRFVSAIWFCGCPLVPQQWEKVNQGWRFLGNEMTPISWSAKHVNLFVDRCDTQTIENIKCVSGKDLNRHGTLNT